MSDLKDELKQDILTETGETLQDQAFLDILYDECKGNIREAMTKVGFPKSTPSSVITKRLGKQIKERAKEYLTAHTARSAVTLVTALDDGNVPGLKNSLLAAKEILDRGGVFKEEELIKATERNIFILPAIRQDD